MQTAASIWSEHLADKKALELRIMELVRGDTDLDPRSEVEREHLAEVNCNFLGTLGYSQVPQCSDCAYEGLC